MKLCDVAFSIIPAATGERTFKMCVLSSMAIASSFLSHLLSRQHTTMNPEIISVEVFFRDEVYLGQGELPADILDNIGTYINFKNCDIFSEQILPTFISAYERINKIL